MPKPRRIRRVGQIVLSLTFVFALLPLARPSVLWLMRSDEVLSLAMHAVYEVPRGHTPERAAPARYRLDLDRVAGEVDRRFLSFAIDSSQVAGGHWWSRDGRVELMVGTARAVPFDFGRPRLRELAHALSPAYLRVGGTEADSLYYALAADADPSAEPPHGYDLTLTRARWDAIAAFVRDAGLELMFTVNAGPGPRDPDGDWQPDNFESLLRYSAERGYPVPVWELGNEVNAFWLTHGLSAHVSGRRYARDMERFVRAVRHHYPDSKVAGAAAFVWPVMGEPPPRFVESFLGHTRAVPDVLTWHYYPQQSRRCWSATRRASPTRLLEPEYLDEFTRHGEHLRALGQRRASAMEVWLGETGGAQCGGEPGVSDRFASSLWWLDQLGLAARGGQRVVVRQTLAGADYGLLDEDSLRPRPDYWASLLWKRLMGARVLGLIPGQENRHLRVYAHCHPDGDGRVSVLAINLAQQHSLRLDLGDLARFDAQRYRVEATELTADQVTLNRQPLQLAADGGLPALLGERVVGAEPLTLAPTSFAITVFDANAKACH